MPLFYLKKSMFVKALFPIVFFIEILWWNAYLHQSKINLKGYDLADAITKSRIQKSTSLLVQVSEWC